MIVAAYIAAAILLVGIILRLTDRSEPTRHATSDPSSEPPSDSSPCCGKHIICEKDLPTTPQYFDDEELDCFANNTTPYSPSDIEQFREILLSLNPNEIAPWVQSLRLRHIPIPDPLRDEILLLLSDQSYKPDL